MAKKIFVTGASGFVVGNFLEHLVEQEKYKNTVFYCPARSESSSRLIDAKGFDPEQVKILKNSDISKEDLGLDKKILAELQNKVDTVIHGAASTTFDSSSAEQEKTWKDNVEGTKNLIEFAKKCKNIEKFIYFGTVFIRGKNNKLIVPEGPLPGMEDASYNPNLDLFNNPYEWSKWHSERLVRNEIRKGLPAIIDRFGILVAKSRDYSCYDGRMIYQYMALIGSVLRRKLRESGIKMREVIINEEPLDLRLYLGEKGVRMIGRNNTKKNFDFLDNVLKFLQKTMEDGKPGETYQRINQNWILGKQIGIALEEALNVKGLSYVGKTIPNPHEIEKTIMAYNSDFQPYTINDDPVCDMTQTNKLLQGVYMAQMNENTFSALLRNYAIREIAKVKIG